MKATVLLLALALTGCTLCREHPTACAAVTIVAAGSLALTAGSSNPNHPHDIGLQPVNCSNPQVCK